MTTSTFSPSTSTAPGQRTAAGYGRLPAIAVCLVAALAWPLLFSNTFLLTIGSLTAITLIAATSLHLVIRMGHISLAHAGFMGIGAYTCVLTVMKLGFPFALGLACGAAAAAAVGLVIGPIVLRLTGKYFVLVTFLLGEIIRMVFVDWTSLTGGSNGTFGVPPPFAAAESPFVYYYFALTCALVCMAFCGRILSSEIGRAMDCMRVAEPLASSSGIPVVRLKVIIFTISCALAGVSGALLAHFLHYVDPSSFGILQSLNLVIMNVIGGMGSIFGAIIGAIFLTVLPELLRSYVELQRVIYGVILIIVMAALPGGIMEIAARLRGFLARPTARES
jgi:branched-chain amino acid transport system permease protein